MALNKPASLHYSVSYKVSQYVTDTPVKLNLINEYIRKNETSIESDKASKRDGGTSST